jgi:hypothetical protein
MLVPMSTRRWGLVVWGLGMAILVGGWLTVVWTDLHPTLLLPIGFILALVGGLMRRPQPSES